MRSLPVIEEKWRSGGPYIADKKPVTRVTVQEPWPDQDGPDFLLKAHNNLGSHQSKHPLRWFQHARNHQPEREIPNIKSIDIDRSIEQDAGTINFRIGNQWLHGHGQAPNQSVLGMPGYFTYNRGESMEARARWGHEPNEWSNMLVPNALLRVFTGFGGDLNDIPTEVAAGNLALYGMFLVDEVVISTDGTINITGRDMAKLLIEQQLFPPLVPNRRYPLTYNRWREENVSVRAAAKQVTFQLDQPGPAVEPGDKRTVYVDSAVDRWYGPNATLYGHKATDSIDGNPHSYALSVGNSGPNRPFAADWWEYECGEAMNSVYLHPWAGNYTMYISVKVNGQWQGNQTVPYDPAHLFRTQSPAVNTGANIPYVAAFTVPHETAREYVLPNSYQAERVRITFRNHAFSGLGVWKYRCGIREVRLRGADPNTATLGSQVEMVNRKVEFSMLCDPYIPAAGMRYDPDKGYSQGYLTVSNFDQSDAFGDARILPIGGGSEGDWSPASAELVGSSEKASGSSYTNRLDVDAPEGGGEANDYQVLIVSHPYGTSNYGRAEIYKPMGWDLAREYISPYGFAQTTYSWDYWCNVSVFTRRGNPGPVQVWLTERTFGVSAIMLNFRSASGRYQLDLGAITDTGDVTTSWPSSVSLVSALDPEFGDGVVPVGQDTSTVAVVAARWSGQPAWTSPEGYELYEVGTENGAAATYSGLAVKEYIAEEPLAESVQFTGGAAHYVGFHMAVSDGADLGGEGTLPHMPTAVCYTPSGDGYYVLSADGTLRTHGDAPFYGTPKVSGEIYAWDMAVTYTGKGYWVLTTDGVAHAFGDAPYMEPAHFQKGVQSASLASHPTDYGVWILRNDGKVWARGAAKHFGQISATGPDAMRYDLPGPGQPPPDSAERAQCIRATSTGKGYWILTSTGRVFNYGDAVNHGQPHTLSEHRENIFNQCYWELLPAPDDKGYLLVHASGQISVHGDVKYFGAPVPGSEARLRYDGDYTDYTDIVKDLILWAGFLLRDENFPDSMPTMAYASLETTGTFSDERLPDEMFDKRPVIDAITALREPVGYISYVDCEGRFIFTSPNWWHIGNFDENGIHQPVLPEIDEAVNVTAYTSSTSDESARSVITISSHDPYADFSGTVTTRYVPPSAADLRGMVKPALWVNDFFMDETEQQIMAELIGLHITFSERLGQVTCLATPHIEINDQVRIYERQTETTHVHYVRGVKFSHDLESGQYLMTLTTHWLGEGETTASPVGGVLPATKLLQGRMEQQQFAKLYKDVGGRVV